jgi:hypothetical protein
MFYFKHFFADAPLLAQGLGLLQMGFTIWMLVDAYHRRVETFWYWVVFCFQPVGPWVYFFAVKFRTPRLRGMRPVHEPAGRKRSLAELRFAVERSPTVVNRFDLADRLMASGAYAEAIPLLEAVLTVEPNYCAVLHALAKCRLATGSGDQAVPHLQRLIRRDNRWSNYLAWHTLIEAFRTCGQPTEALAACRELARYQPTLENNCLLAELMIGAGNPDEARRVLHDALEEHGISSWTARWHNRRWARKALLLWADADAAGKAPEVAATNQPSPAK